MKSKHAMCSAVGAAAIAAFPVFLHSAAVAAEKPVPYRAEPAVTPGQTVIERPRPEVEALGGRVGQFLVFPSISLAEQYDDNVFSTTNNTVDDFITIVRPSVRVKSDWNNHELNAFGWGAIARYASESDENWADAAFGADYRHDIARSTAANVGFKFARLHEDRSSTEDVSGAEPTTYTLMEPNVGATHKFGRFKVGVDGSLRKFNFSDTDAVNGGTINNDDRDRNEWQGGVRLGYEIRPEYEAFVRSSYNVRKYSDAVDDNGFDRDSNGYEMVVGTAANLTDLVVGEVFVGYRSQDFDDSRLSTVSGVGGGANLTWSVTKLTSVSGYLTRTVEDTTEVNTSGYFLTRLGVQVDHELLRNLLIGASGGYAVSDYEGISRTDDTYSAGAYVKYLTNRYLDLSAQYQYAKRESDVAAENFDKNVFMIQATAKY